MNFTYQWERDDGDIAGASGTAVVPSPGELSETYIPVTGDIGHTVRLRASDGTNTYRSAWSGTITAFTPPSLIDDLSFSGGTTVPPWDGAELSGVTSVAVISSPVPGYANAANFRMHPGTQTNPGLHNRALLRKDHAAYNWGPGSEVYLSFVFVMPTAGNSGGVYRGGMITEIIHNANGIVHSMIAPLSLHQIAPSETWNGTSWGTPTDTSTSAICLNVTAGYVPGQGVTNPPAQNQAYWHTNVYLPGFQPIPTIPVWGIFYVAFHEYAGGSPPGGYNVHPSPDFIGADRLPGKLKLWMVASSTQPSVSAFVEASPLISFTNVPTLVYGDDGAGHVKHDQPYGPFIGSYDPAATINYDSQVVWPGMWLANDFASARAQIAV